MYVICIESSNNRGMGHLFRALLYVSYFKQHNISFLLLINNDPHSLELLDDRKIKYLVVDFNDVAGNWEGRIIEQYNVTVWINDKFETSLEMGKHISDTGVLFCLIDDVGQGELYADFHFAGMIYPTRKEVGGRYTFCGKEYIILNPQIALYRHRRVCLNRIIVSLGGSDPHGVTLEVIRELTQYNYQVDIVIGPNFNYIARLRELNRRNFSIFQNVPSLVETFSNYDLAITGGGVTCCEANAAGLPCIIIANAPHEKNTGRYMESFGGSIYAGSYDNWNKDLLSDLDKLNISEMSMCALNNFDLNAIDRIMNTINETIKNGESKK